MLRNQGIQASGIWVQYRLYIIFAIVVILIFGFLPRSNDHGVGLLHSSSSASPREQAANSTLGVSTLYTQARQAA